jgi:hypothetical protein
LSAPVAAPDGVPSADAITQFWTWFVAHESEYRKLGSLADSSYDVLTSQLGAVHSDLVPELAENPDGTHTLVISANGLRTAFAAVRAVVAAAPTMGAWRAVAFRQPDPTPDWQLNFGDLSVKNQDVRVLWEVRPEDPGETIDISTWLPVPGDTPAEALATIGFVVLDHAIGEEATETRIGGMEWRAGPAPMAAKSLEQLRLQLSVPATPR